MCCKRTIALKFRQVFLWAIPLNAIKTLSTGELCTTCFKIKNQKLSLSTIRGKSILHISSKESRISRNKLCYVLFLLRAIYRRNTSEINRPFPSSLVPLFQSESNCETILMKMTLICMKIIKSRPNDRNMPTQHVATLLGATCCVRLATVLRHVGCCWLKFENGQI